MALRLNPAPTFRAKVGIPVPGQEKPEVIVCEFKHMTRDAFRAFSEQVNAGTVSEVDSLMAMLAGWDGVDAPFSREAVQTMVQAYHGAAYAIAQDYARELTAARLGN